MKRSLLNFLSAVFAVGFLTAGAPVPTFKPSGNLLDEGTITNLHGSLVRKNSDGSITVQPQGSLFGDWTNKDTYTLGRESANLGGDYDTDGDAVHRQLSVVGRPYGNWGAGCTLCIFSTESGYWGGGAQAALSGNEYHTGAPSVAGGDAALAGFYQFEENFPARISAQVKAFTTDGLTFTTPLTDRQLKTLHEGMYVTTNVIPGDADLELMSNAKTGDTTFTVTDSYMITHAEGLKKLQLAISGTGVNTDTQITDMNFSWDNAKKVWYWTMSLNKGLTANLAAGSTIHATLVKVDGDGRPLELGYWGYIRSFDANSIQVYGWALLGHGNSDGNQVPDPGRSTDSSGKVTYANLDKIKTPYPVPMVFAGVPGKIWSKNTYVAIDGDKIYGKNATTKANAYEREELDFRASNFNNPNTVSYHGWTTSFQCIPCASNATAKDSYAYLVNGPGLPRAYIAQLYGNGIEYSGYSTWIPGNGAPPNAVGNNHIMWLYRSALASNNRLNFSAQVVQDFDGAWHWSHYGIRLGLNVDGDPKAYPDWDQFSGGVDMGDILFNGNAGAGNICFETGGRVLTACSNSNGEFQIRNILRAPDARLGTIYISSASMTNLDTNGGTFQGQGTVYTWNETVNAETDIVNVQPGDGYSGGFRFYAGVLGHSLKNDSDTMLLLDVNRIQISAYKPFYANSRIEFTSDAIAHNGLTFKDDASGDTVYLKYNTNAKAVTLTSDKIAGVGLQMAGVTFENLPAIADTSTFRFCTSCWSKLRERGDQETGILVRWSGTKWVDTVGIEVQH